MSLSSCESLTNLCSAAGGELVLTQWTRPVESESKETSQSQPETKPETPAQQEYELRPLWQRIPMVGLQIAATATICMVLLRARSRTVRRLYILPSDASANASLAQQPKRTLVLQNVWQFGGQGKVFPFAGTLERSPRDEEIILSIPQEGDYLLPLAKAKINGTPADSTYSAKDALFKEWYGPEKGVKELAKHGWVD